MRRVGNSVEVGSEKCSSARRGGPEKVMKMVDWPIQWHHGLVLGARTEKGEKRCNLRITYKKGWMETTIASPKKYQNRTILGHQNRWKSIKVGSEKPPSKKIGRNSIGMASRRLPAELVPYTVAIFFFNSIL